MKTLSKYIRNLNYDYAISYSGLRGELFDKLEQTNKEKIEILEEEIESARFMQKPKLNQRIKDLRREIDIYNSKIINSKGEIHKSTVQISKLKKGDRDLEDIFEPLFLEMTNPIATMCAPIFRDAVVFYSDTNEINGILQICFSCLSIKNENEDYFDVDYEMFQKLKDKLVQIGHPIENE